MEVPGRDPLENVHRIERLRRRLDAEMLEEISRVDRGWIDDPCIPDLSTEMAATERISSNTAWERLRMARALRELPAIALAHAEGRLSWDQLRWVTKFATAATDAQWAERAPTMRPKQLRVEAERQTAVRRATADREHRMRRFRMEWDEERRFLEIYGELPAEQGAAVEDAVTAAAEHITVEEDV